MYKEIELTEKENRCIGNKTTWDNEEPNDWAKVDEDDNLVEVQIESR